jgi:hypothetical protein
MRMPLHARHDELHAQQLKDVYTQQRRHPAGATPCVQMCTAASRRHLQQPTPEQLFGVMLWGRGRLARRTDGRHNTSHAQWHSTDICNCTPHVYYSVGQLRPFMTISCGRHAILSHVVHAYTHPSYNISIQSLTPVSCLTAPVKCSHRRHSS